MVSHNWDDLKFFHAVHKAGTMVAAARQLGTNVATVSRRIDRLGEKLGAQVFIKQSGEWLLNPEFEDLLMLVEDFEARLATERSRISLGSPSTNKVTLRIGAPPIVLAAVLARNVDSFLSGNDGYLLELHTRTAPDGLGDMDVMLMARPPQRGRLMTRRVGQIRFGIYGFDTPTLHDGWVGLVEEYEGNEPMRKAISYFNEPPSVRTSSFFDALHVAMTLRAPVLLPVMLAKQHPSLKPLLPEDPPLLMPFWVAYHSSRKSDQVLSDAVAWIASSFEGIEHSVNLKELAPARPGRKSAFADSSI